MTGERCHLSDVIDINDCIPVNALERDWLESGLEGPKSLGGQVTAFWCDDPYQLCFRLKRQDFVGIEEEIFAACPANELAADVGRGRIGSGSDHSKSFRDLQGLPHKALSPFHRLPEPGFAHRLQEIIDGACLKRFNRMLVKRSNDYNHRQTRPAQIPDHLKTAHCRHLEIEKHEIRLQIHDLLQGLPAILGFTDNFNVRQEFQFFPEDLPGNLFIVSYESLDGSIHL